MIKIFTLALTCGLMLGCFAADTIYRGNSKQKKDIICYYQGGKFYSDEARTKLLYNHPGNVVSKDLNPAYGTGLYRLVGNKIYKGFSIDKKDCIGTLFETKTQKGNVLEAVIYKGVVTFKDKTEKREPGGITIVTEYTVQENGKYVQGVVLYTIKDNKIYRGKSTDAGDCLLTFTGNFTSARLLFMAVELTK